MQQANENQARRDRSCFEYLTIWDLNNDNHDPALWGVKDREEDVEYQERRESEEGDEEEEEEEEEEEYVCVIIEESVVEEDEEEEEEEEEEYEVTCVGEYVEEEEEEEEYEVTCVGEYVEEEEEEEEYEVTCLVEYVEEEEEEECLLKVVVKEEEEEEVEEDQEERVDEKEKKEKGENNTKGEEAEEEEQEEEEAEEEEAEEEAEEEEEEEEEEAEEGEEEGEEEEEKQTATTYPRCVHHQGLKLSVKRLTVRQTGEEKYGQLREIIGEQYVREVTCAPKGDRVVLHLYHPSVPMCSLLNHHLSHLATKFPECKFLMIVARHCVPNYPVSHLPTLFIYDSGCILNSMIGAEACGGRNVLEYELKWMLAQSGAFVIDSYEALYQEGTPIMTPCSEQEQEYYSDDQSDHYDNQGTEV